VAACPQKMFAIILDDYDEEVAAIKDESRKSIKYLCGPCKPTRERRELPCQKACQTGAITHSW
jgi:Fe-S-cluster-containing hydrogenase component 2